MTRFEIETQLGLPRTNEKHGYSEEVLVRVRCPNGSEITKLDKYDSFSKSWLEYPEEYGYTVLYYAYLRTQPYED